MVEQLWWIHSIESRSCRTRDRQAGLAREESFRSPLSTFPDLLFLFSPAGDYLAYHTTDPALLPAAPAQFLGKNVHDVLPHEIAERLIASCGRVWHTGQSEAVEYPLPVAGEIRHYEGRVTAYDGQRLLAIVRDITARKKTETELRAQEQLLENLLAVARTIYERPSVRATLQNALEIALALTGATGGERSPTAPGGPPLRRWQVGCTCNWAFSYPSGRWL